MRRPAPGNQPKPLTCPLLKMLVLLNAMYPMIKPVNHSNPSHLIRCRLIRRCQIARPFFLRGLLLLFTATVAVSGQGAGKPNVIIIVADDLGYADIGVNGCKDIPTPHIDQIARNGVRFARGYANQPVCAPSRAGLISGMYQHRFGFENNSGPEKTADPKFGLPRGMPTLADKMKSAGYATGIIGKWHLGFQEEMHPNKRGFDYFYGFIGGSRSYDPKKSQAKAPLLRNGKIVTDEKEFLTDAFTREAVDFIQRNSGANVPGGIAPTTASTADASAAAPRPYFLYLAFNAVHLPLEATPEYKNRFQHIKDPKRKTYAAMLSAMDDGIGRVMDKVRETGQEENTLVFFYSDNGGPTSHTTSSNAPLRGEKGSMYEGGIRVPFLMQWKGTVPGGITYENPVMGFDCHATALAAAGISTASLDGRDLVLYVTGGAASVPHENLYWRWGPQNAVIKGDWKLVRSSADAPTELYNLKTDIAEKNNIAADKPAKVKELSANFAEWEKGMIPPAWESRPWGD